MTEPTPTNPSPTAVPWTPDMMAPQNPPNAQPQIQAQPYQAQQPQSAPMQSQPQQPAQQPQPQAMLQAYPAPSQYAAQPVAQPTPQHMPQAGTPSHTPQAFTPQTQYQPAQFATSHPHHPQMASPQQPYLQTAQPHHAQPQTTQHFTQAGPPPLAPHMRVPATLPDQTPAIEPESKSLFAKLLKRSPKPVETQSEIPAPAANSGSLFNKNFALGALTGLVIGAFVLPMALNMFSSEAPVQAQAQAGPPAGFEAMPTAVEGETFIDEAIAADAP